jgi:Predicted helicases
LIIFNSISNAQRFKNKLNNSLLIHSGFIDVDRTKIMNLIYDNYGKNSEVKINKPNVIGTHVLQASLDISFSHLYESILSPESSLQRIGRCDRWGIEIVDSTINIYMNNNPGENIIREILYSRNLSNLWFDYISEYNGQKINLNQLYQIYNEFYEKYNKVLKEFVINKYTTSLDVLSNIYPIKFYNKNNKTDVFTAGGNKLRTSGSEIFFICKIYNSDKYTDPISTQTYNNISKTFNEEGDVRGRIIRVMKDLRNANDSRFDFNDIIDNKHITLDSIRNYGKKSNTPYIRFDKVYHHVYGIIDEETLILYEHGVIDEEELILLIS